MQDDTATTQVPRLTDLDDTSEDGYRPPQHRSRTVDERRSPNTWVCPFLRASGDDGGLGRPVEVPHTDNRCSALHDPVPQSLRQQELVCLTSAHVNCPRYVRGSVLGTGGVERVAGPQVVTPAIAGSVVVVIVAFLLSIAFVVVNGGLTLTAAGVPRSPSPLATAVAALETVSPTMGSTPSPTGTPSETEVATPTALATPTRSAAPTPTPQRTPKPTGATPAYPAGATASRMKLLSACSDAPRCYVYRIRSGDNLYSIASYFGVPLSTVRAWNTWTQNGLKVGRELRIPPPTR